ncbi:calcium-binding protein [Patulibacter sp.]|uniref:calcium-binding protein n=1 Tax=Patulibacter sp. TaxID=1912859 RepID=UPI00272629FC|nr:calcium-binding protein [Patulibacter sp.]MDO9409762.1 calcium-binding protein [Patulibacter sp.]
MFRFLSCLLVLVVLCVGVVAAEPALDPVDTAEARALAVCPTAKRPRAQYARCYVDRPPYGNDFFNGTGAKEYFNGGPGNDKIVARGGADRIIGGPGQDRISAGDGNNVILVRDGEVDRVACGRGRNTIQRDAIDVISPNCYGR